MSRFGANLICGPPRFAIVLLALVAVGLTPAVAQWVEFEEQTSLRSDADPARFADDGDEKDYAWGDVDRDGDLDLAIVRKEPFTSAGKRVNVLLMNINGVLTDRTIDFAQESDVPGDLGFNTPTNDRDVIMSDLNNDGWLDMVTTTAISNGDPQHIGYPRVYMNKCCSVGGCSATSCTTSTWLGFRYEFDRIPEMLSDQGQAGFNPCFCAVNAGDVNEDGYNDLWFVDYDTSCGGGGSPQDFNDKLLLNQGVLNPGYFVDVTETNFIGGAAGFPDSAFGASGGVAKFNEDDSNDLLRQFAGSIDIAYNSSTPGVFDRANEPPSGSSYFVSYGDLNQDNKLDLINSDDGQDRYILNQGDGTDDMADFISFAFSYSHNGPGGASSDDGFSGNSIVADLDKDDWPDVLITDIDVDVGGCDRRMHIFKNLGGTPGGAVTLQEQTSGTGCENFMGNPASCIVTTIPADKLEGTHDVAVFDINGDGWDDMVVGRCAGTEVYINIPDFLPGGGVPDGNGVPGSMLTLGKNGSTLELSWGDSCTITDNDYSIYEGPLFSDFQVHAARVCTTGGATTQSLGSGIGPESSYFLVAPRNEDVTGALGTDSQGQPRHAGVTPCSPQVIGSCN